MLPSSAAVSWIPTLTAGVGITSAAIGTSLISTPSPVMAPMITPATAHIPLTPSTAVMALGAELTAGEGLLPVPLKLQQKIIKLDFVEMRELLPETWQREEEDAGGRAFWPKKPAGPITDILQWVQCFAALAGVLAKSYPSMVPEFMAYLATIVKCARDFEGITWAQYDRAYRRQVAQTKDLRWSRLNPTLYSLCFAGKAKRNMVCANCLSDSHHTASCPDNAVFFPWQGLPTQPTPPAQAQPAVAMGPAKPRFSSQVCYLFNDKEGPRCTYPSCKFAHRCAICKGPHARFFCRQREAGGSQATRAKRPRTD